MRFLARLALGAVLLGGPSVAAAQTPEPPPSTARDGLGLGIRGGFGFDPEQVVLGLHFSAGKAFDLVRIVPNVHVGFGDVTTVDLHVDLLLRAILQDAGLGLYGGVAPALVIPTGEGGDTELGASFVAGVQVPLFAGKATSFETRLGFWNAPEVRLLFVITP